jgi:hypothetical protein
LKHSRIHIILLLMGILLFPGSLLVMAQQSNTFYLMHDVPQSSLLNPAVQLRCRFYVGIPLLASTHFTYSNTAFTYNDLAGTDTWNLEGVLGQMHRVDLYAVEARLQPISLGYRRKSLYFTFNIAERFHGYQTIPKDLAETVISGNGPFVGERAKFNALRPDGTYLREYSLGISKVISPELTAGVRAKLLFGKASIQTGRSSMELTTREDNFGLNVEGAYTLNGSFPATITQDAEGNIDGIVVDGIDPVALLLNRGNRGVAIDLGLIYKYDERITLSASLLDLGFVRWKTDLNNVHGEGTFVFEGVDFNTYIVSRAFFSEMRDSLINSLEITNTTNPYSDLLPSQLFLAGSYKYSDRISFGLVNRNLVLRNKIHSSFTLSAQADLAERFLATLSWSYLNNSIKNVGVGIALHGNGIQFHAVTDNLLGFFYPFDTRTLNLRFGINLMFGCPRNKKEELQEASYGKIPQGGYCPYPEKPERIKKKRLKATRRLNRI